MRKANVYIDGFNFYYGAVKGTPHKWLDLRRLCELSCPNLAIHRIKYFTANVKPLPGDPDQPKRQKAYLNALQTIKNLTVIRGYFKVRDQRRPLAVTEPGHPARVWVTSSEEKGSDVNLATELLLDAFRRDFDVAVIISDDSDLIAPIHGARRVLKAPVGVINPYPPIDPNTGQPRSRLNLQSACLGGDPRTVLFYQHLDTTLLPLCHLPDPVIHPTTKKKYFKPKGW